MHWLQRIDDDIRRQRSLRDDDDEHEPSAMDRGRDTGEKDNVNPVITANEVELEFDDDRTARDETRVRSVRSRVRTRKRNHRWSLRSRALFAALVASLMLTVFISLVLSLRMLSLSEENDELRHQNELRDAELAQMLRRLLREGIELKVQNGPDLWPVHADETQLSNAIINLVVNARDAMPSGGRLSITTETVEISDGRHRPGVCRSGSGWVVMLGSWPGSSQSSARASGKPGEK